MFELLCVVIFKFLFESPFHFPVLKTKKIKFTNNGRTCMAIIIIIIIITIISFYLSGHLSSTAATLPKKEQINKLELRRSLSHEQ